MVSADMLLFLHRRLQEIPEKNMIFGGLSIFVLGDLFQLPPPARKTLYNNPSVEMAKLYGSLWKKHFKVVELCEIMRQKDDISFAELLNRVRTGQQTDEDITLLQFRETSAPPEDILHVFTTNASVDQYNNERLECLPTQKFTVMAHDSKKDTTTGTLTVKLSDKPTQTGGLRTTITVAVGARVMLTYNVSTSDGLVNGAKGTMTGFIPEPQIGDFDENYKPKFILVNFDNPDVGHQTRQLYGRHIPACLSVSIVRQQIQLQLGKYSTVSGVRYQFPLTLAWATTIHKVQGETLNSIYVAVHCDGYFQPGQLYVAISREKSLSGLHLTHFDCCNQP